MLKWNQMNENEKYLFASQLMELLDRYHKETSEKKQEVADVQSKLNSLQFENELISESLDKYFHLYIESNNRAKAAMRELNAMIASGAISLRAAQLIAAHLAPPRGN